MSLLQIAAHLEDAGWGRHKGIYAVVDGQYGSTGKGLAAALLADLFADRFDLSTCNAGPNSGHTSYLGDRKIVLRQLPTFGVTAGLKGRPLSIHLNAGAIIDVDVLLQEIKDYVSPNTVRVHPNAAIVSKEALAAEEGLKLAVGSTGKGTGAALAAKIMRQPGSTAADYIAKLMRRGGALPFQSTIGDMNQSAKHSRIMMEVSQGFSLGIDQRFYPFTTSRNCTVGAALSDAGAHPSFLRQTMMVVRTYPIRVGGNSGPCYDDQKEITWEELGQEAERTTVTNKVRRVFTWSDEQFKDACLANRPEHIFLNFVNYLDPKVIEQFVERRVVQVYRRALGHWPSTVLLGFGPRNTDVDLWRP